MHVDDLRNHLSIARTTYSTAVSEEDKNISSERGKWKQAWYDFLSKSNISMDRFNRSIDSANVTNPFTWFDHNLIPLPKFILRKYSQLDNGIVLTNRRMQWGYATSFNTLFNVFYYFLMYCTEYFRKSNKKAKLIRFNTKSSYYLVSMSSLQQIFVS
jgi:hypothetical protein